MYEKLNERRYTQFDPDQFDEPKFKISGLEEAARFIGLESDDPTELRDNLKIVLLSLVDQCSEKANASEHRAVRVAVRKVRAGLESIIVELFGKYKSNLTIMQRIREEIDRTLDDFSV